MSKRKDIPENTTDACLVAALRALPSVEPDPVSWPQALAAHRRVRQTALSRAWRPALATAALAVALVIGLHRESPTPLPPVPAQAVDASSFVRAHNMLSAADVGGDPNRAVLLRYSGTGDGE